MKSCMIRPALVVMLFSIAALAGCSFQPDEEIWEISGPVFGTQYHVKVVMSDDKERMEAIAGGIIDELEDVDASMSTWRDDSELSRFNQRADGDRWFPVSDSF